MRSDTSIGIVLGGILVVMILGLAHLINWLLTKGIIWVLYELFNVNWYGKFWVVYIASFIFGIIIKGTVSIKK